MQNPQPQPPTITYVYTAPPDTSTRPGYASKTSRALGITQVLMGVALIILQVLSIVYYAGFYFVGHGIWTGIIIIIAGSFGIAAAGNKSSCLIITFMVMSIIAAAFSTVPFGLSAGAIPLDQHGGFDYYYGRKSEDTKIALDVAMLVASFVEIVAAIWSSVICCKSVCCSNQTNALPQGQVVQYAQAPPGTTGAQPMSIVIAGPSGLPQQGVPQTYMYAGVQAPQQFSVPQGHPGAMKAQQGGDSPPPAYSADNPIEQKSMPMPN